MDELEKKKLDTMSSCVPDISISEKLAIIEEVAGAWKDLPIDENLMDEVRHRTTNISEISTKALVEELSKRAGVEKIEFAPEEEFVIGRMIDEWDVWKGPQIVLRIFD